jgi:hypothetical protein
MNEDLNPNPNNQTSSVISSTASSPSVQNQAENSSSSFLPDLFLVNLIFFSAVFGVAALTITLLFFRRLFYYLKKFKDWKKIVFIEIAVPKDTAEQVQKERAGSSQNGDKDMIGIGEQLFTIINEYGKNSFQTWFFGAPKFSLEIVNIDQQIRFWVATTEDIASVLERQIVAIYPKANIHREKNINFFKPGTVAHAQELSLNRRFELPFKTYMVMNDEPLNTITNALGGLQAEESAAVQLIITPINDQWQKKPREIASKINQGQNPEDFLFPEENPLGWIVSIFKFFGSIIGSFFEKKDDKDPYKQEKKDRRGMDISGRYEGIQLTEQQREVVKKLEEKASKPGFVFTLRVVSSARNQIRAKQIVDGVVPAFQIYDVRPFNWFKKDKTDVKKSVVNFLLRSPKLPKHRYGQERTDIINTEEICSLWHIPNYMVTTPNIKWLLARRPPIPLEVPASGDGNVYIGTAVSRGQSKDCYLKMEDRFRHIYSLGGSGSGKTIQMMNVMLQDIEMGNGICFVDPHGEGVDDILRRIPEHRMKDVILFSPSITDKPLGLNMLETDPLKPTQKTLVIDTLFTIWDKLYDLKKTGGPMFENYMKNSMRLVMSHPESGATLMEISKVLVDEDFRSFKLAMCNEPEVVDFWEKEATKAGGEASLENMVPYITSKLAPFITNDFIKPMIGQQKSAIQWREAMDNKKIILVSLSKGLIGENSAYLVGMVIIGGLLMAGMGRSDGLKYNEDGTTTEITPDQRSPFFVYIDEMQNFLFDSIPKALEEIRKYKVGFYLAHQFIKQVVVQGDERIKDSIMANCATKCIYRCGSDDAKYLESEFSPLSIQDIANPEARTYNAILLVDGQRTTPFNIQATFPKFFENVSGSKMAEAEAKRKQLVEMTKDKYGRPREEIEKEIKDRAKLLF